VLRWPVVFKFSASAPLTVLATPVVFLMSFDKQIR
jgi:hypothetical protein